LTLIEVLVALGILASALIAVVALFGVGGRGFRSGRSMTQAVAIAESVLEEVNGLGYEQLPQIFPSCCGAGCDTARGCTVSAEVDVHAAARWGSLVEGALHRGNVAIVLTPIGGGARPPTFSSAEGLRVLVRVGWWEGSRERSVELVTVRF